MEGDEYSEHEGDTPLEEATAGTVVAVTLLAGFGLLFAGFEFFWVAFIVGFAGLLPAALGLVKHYQRDDGPAPPKSDTDAALEELRQRYARGELTEAEFERRVERLLETESVGAAREHAGRTTEQPGDRATERGGVDRPAGANDAGRERER